MPGKLPQALAEARGAGGAAAGLDEAVTEVVAELKERGFNSPYLRAFVVARINPLRFMKGEPPPVDELLATHDQAGPRAWTSARSSPRTSRARAARPESGE